MAREADIEHHQQVVVLVEEVVVVGEYCFVCMSLYVLLLACVDMFEIYTIGCVASYERMGVYCIIYVLNL